MSIEAMKLAREVIQDYVDEHGPHEKDSGAAYTLMKLDQAIEQAQKQEPAVYDMSEVIGITHSKTKHIIESRGYKVTGFVLTNDKGQKCISDMSAVRWFDDHADFFVMMHGQTPPQRQPLTDEQIADLWSAQIFHINDLKLAKDFVRDIEAAHGIKGEA